jgi:hypothetical protein
MPEASRKREGQRTAREFRKLSPAKQLEVAAKNGLVMKPFPWKLGAGVEYICIAYIGDGPGGLEELAESFPDECAVVEVPATVAAFRTGSQAHDLLARAMEGAI